MKQLLAYFFLVSLIGCAPEPEQEQLELTPETATTPTLALRDMLNEWSASFVHKVDSSYRATLNFKLEDAPDSYQVTIANNAFAVGDSTSEAANFTFTSTLEHYNKMYHEEITAMTSMGQATSADPIPLVPEIHKPVTDNGVNDFLFVAQRFFNKTPYDRVQLGLDHSRVVHGGHAIPIFYQKTEDIGVRSAWYQLNQGERVNDIGDTNPFPQYFIITKGNGFVKIGDDTISVKANEAYFVPPNHDHVFWNESEEPLTMLFLAWGKGA